MIGNRKPDFIFFRPYCINCWKSGPIFTMTVCHCHRCVFHQYISVCYMIRHQFLMSTHWGFVFETLICLLSRLKLSHISQFQPSAIGVAIWHSPEMNLSHLGQGQTMCKVRHTLGQLIFKQSIYISEKLVSAWVKHGFVLKFGYKCTPWGGI